MEARRRENPGDSIKDHIVRRFYNQRCDEASFRASQPRTRFSSFRVVRVKRRRGRGGGREEEELEDRAN